MKIPSGNFFAHPANPGYKMIFNLIALDSFTN